MTLNYDFKIGDKVFMVGYAIPIKDEDREEFKKLKRRWPDIEFEDFMRDRHYSEAYEYFM